MRALLLLLLLLPFVVLEAKSASMHAEFKPFEMLTGVTVQDLIYCSHFYHLSRGSEACTARGTALVLRDVMQRENSTLVAHVLHRNQNLLAIGGSCVCGD